MFGETFPLLFCFPLQTQLGRHKCSSRRHKDNPRRSVSEAAPCFGNLCVYEPSALREKPSILGRSLLICGTSCAAKAFRKSVPNVGVIFFDAYCIMYTRQLMSPPLLCCATILPFLNSFLNETLHIHAHTHKHMHSHTL